jgi:hypothetical protein
MTLSEEGSSLRVALEGGSGGWLWRVALEGGSGGWLWRVALEGGSGGWLWRVALEGLRCLSPAAVPSSVMPEASQKVAGGRAKRHPRRAALPGTAPRQGVPETTRGTSPLPPLCGVGCFLDRVPGVSLRSTPV